MKRALFAVLVATIPFDVHAQIDTTRRTVLDSIRITAERAPRTLGTVSSSVTRLTSEELSRTPHRTIADMLRMVPGVALVDKDGMGFDPQLVVRGFYGGGETEYALVLVDGIPVSQLQSGLIAWDALPPVEAVESIEVLRGNASAQYGDAAIGTVVNVITRHGSADGMQASIAGGSFGTWRGALAAQATLADKPASFSVGIDRTGGYRVHGQRMSGRAAATVDVVRSERSHVGVSLRSHWRDFEDPGPLLSTFLEAREASDPLFRFDETNDQSHMLAVNTARWLSGNVRGTLTGGVEWRDVHSHRTLALDPGFGDTKERLANSSRQLLHAQLEFGETPIPLSDRFVFGADVARHSLDNEWYHVVQGNRTAYRESDGARGDHVASGNGSRLTGALYADYAVDLVPRVQFSAGARADVITDTYQKRGEPEDTDANHVALSPRAALVVQYLDQPGAAGNLFVNATRSFRAPTLDQLFDQRPIPLPFPPYETTFSNADLSPQYGSGFEVGIYHLQSVTSHGSLFVSASMYDTRMLDEVDFDITTLGYRNIARSRHRGGELGLKLNTRGPLSLFANYAVQRVRVEQGDNVGKQLKGIPLSIATVGAGMHSVRGLQAQLSVSLTGPAWLDDANTQKLSGFTRADMRVAYEFANVQLPSLFLDVTNLFDARYNSTGYLDTGGSGAQYVSPAAGRIIQLGVRYAR